MNTQYAGNYTKFTSGTNRVPIHNSCETVFETNQLGIYTDNCGYESTPRDYQSVTQDCAALGSNISSAYGCQNLPQGFFDCAVKAKSRYVGNITSYARKNAFNGRPVSGAKRSRTVFQPHQIRRLQYEFEREMYMVGMKRRNLSKELDLSEKQIKIWFQNRRMKEKRDYNRKRRRSIGNLPDNGTDRGKYFQEFALEALKMSESTNVNNTQLLML